MESVQLYRPPPRQATGGELCALRCKPSRPPLEAASHLTTWSVSLERPLQSLHWFREPIPRYLRWPRPYRFLRLPGRAIVQGPRQWLHNPHQADRRHVATHHSRGGPIERTRVEGLGAGHGDKERRTEVLVNCFGAECSATVPGAYLLDDRLQTMCYLR